MSKSRKYIFLILAVPVFLSLQFCKKQTEQLPLTPVSAYYPTQVGKYIVYQMDSTVFTNFETTQEIHSYQLKDIIDAEVTDNMGRASFRIRRMIRDSAGINPWTDIATLMVTPLANSIEYVENNLRYIKLKAPVKENYFWQGNSYINAEGPLDYLKLWEYNYINVDEPYNIDNTPVNNTVTVLHIDESTGDPLLSPNNIASKNYSMEIYGKDIGLIYKDLIHWLYQKNNTLGNCRVIVEGQADTPCPYNLNCDSLAQTMSGYMKCDTVASRYSYDGYGIRLKMLEHN